MELTSGTFVKIENGTLSCYVNSLAEAKIALKELRIKRKECSVLRRELHIRLKEIRQSYTDKVRRRGSLTSGGGTLGKFFRGVRAISRDSAKMNLAKDVAPLENHINQVDRIVTAIDAAIVQLEAKMLTM